MLFNDCIILAGGSGTRLWPASNTCNPKQFLSVPPHGSFFSNAIERALAVLENDDSRVIIVAGRSHVSAIADCSAFFSEAQRKRLVLIPEPEAKNTAPAIAAAIMYASLTKETTRKMLILTSDHLISPLEVFRSDAAAAATFTLEDNLVVFGIPPQFANTGYGYIEASDLLPVPHLEIHEKSEYEPHVFRALSFREKPDRKKAEEFLEKGNFFWNSGMFAFTSQFMIDEFRNSALELFDAFSNLNAPDKASYELSKGLRILERWKGLDDAYKAAPKISFDYAIAEKCSKTVMVKAAFQWIDVGCWDEYVKLLDEAGCHEAAQGEETDPPGIFRCASQTSFVDSDIPVALVNAEGLIVVIRSGKNGGPTAALIAKKGETQKVQQIVEQIKAAGRTELL